jgi:hypothetical protein
MIKKSNKKRKNEVIKLSEDLLENIATLVAQCNLTSAQADNDDAHINSFVKSIKGSVNTPEEVMLVWKSLLNAYVSRKVKRGAVIRKALMLFRPFNYFVYLLVKDGDIIYVGKTINVQDRMKDHTSNKDFDDIRIFACSTKQEQDVLENTCIFKYCPPLNRSVRLKEVDKEMELPAFVSAKDFYFPFLTGCTSKAKVFFLADENYYFFPKLGFVYKPLITAEIEISLLTADPNYEKPTKTYPEGYTYIRGVGLIKDYN